MFFIPFKVDLFLYRLPVVTLLVVILCIGVYYGQAENETAVKQAAESFCKKKGETIWRVVLSKTAGAADPAACLELMWEIHLSDTPEQVIEKFAARGATVAGMNRADDLELKRRVITDRFAAFERDVPKYDTQQLWYQPDSWDVKDMITASFAHGSWSHVIGNLFFFFAFAAAIELIVGPIFFTAVILGLAVGTNIFYSLAMYSVAEPLPTVGLSGVVMGVMTLFTFFMPRERIKCFFWFLLIVRVLSVPAWLLVVWYIGWDAYDLFVLSDTRSGVNLTAHVSGAALGYLIGVIFFRERRRKIKAQMIAQELPAI
ncbi:hypothetical protein MNBD_GAMMA15-569 [hydrothermal vent metagenome]|uniref:Peptidase S54 rhomboid domain-containing protein n=1 Tax=hydrothermal vent metagenome TaxID=652676 RepID=A0A3B0YP48_9ZZZZ